MLVHANLVDFYTRNGKMDDVILGYDTLNGKFMLKDLIHSICQFQYHFPFL